ncbi:hypothetical protein JTB14_009583 [Gonioctena quinquepunctata]|nr:hypothetical protein JTB14_009583 [Gonioctena quinquepunctata]
MFILILKCVHYSSHCDLGGITLPVRMANRSALTNKELFELMEDGLYNVELLIEDGDYGWENDKLPLSEGI